MRRLSFSLFCVVRVRILYCAFHCPKEANPLGKKGVEPGLQEQCWAGFAVAFLKHISRFAAAGVEVGKKGE